MIEAVFSNKKMYNAEMTVVMASRSSNYCLGGGYLVPDDVYKCFQGLVKIGIPLDSPTFYTVCEAEKAAFDEAENKREEEEAKDGPVDSDAEEGDDDDAADEADSDDADPKSETKMSCRKIRTSAVVGQTWCCEEELYWQLSFGHFHFPFSF
ncbi:uncharacterized protein LOC113767526 isoform X1 [Coffea eugenioides]|uniref:uncharacterized protein LOC113767526 isoform X1 n=1 Tax=Coffea eugenioides TaxID=49369 RepID=UPI000F608724|nr:uncharacterized protein LOC113767526 isoform X1 [Coffea eugenioides]